jgi:hypothetical protein
MNDRELARLAELASWRLVDATRTNEWDHVRDVVARLFARGGIGERWIERRLDATRNRIAEASHPPSTRIIARNRETEQWRARFAELLDDHPDVADDLRALLDEIGPSSREHSHLRDSDVSGFTLGPADPASAPEAPIDCEDDGFFGVVVDDDFFDAEIVEAEHRVPRLESHDPVSRAIQAAVKPGLLAFSTPDEMTQGHKERVEVAIVSSAELRDALIASLQGPLEIEEIPASQFMEVELRGDTFKIAPLSKPNQVVAPTARWQYDVWPLRAGLHTLTLSVSLSLENLVPGAPPSSRISVPVFERQIRIRVNLGYSTRSFLASNWQWLVGTGIGAGGTAAAFLLVFH